MRKRYTVEELKKYIAKKHWDKLVLEEERIDYDSDEKGGYRIFLPVKNGWCYEHEGQHLITADTLDELLVWVSTLMPCYCDDDCKKHWEKQNG